MALATKNPPGSCRRNDVAMKKLLFAALLFCLSASAPAASTPTEFTTKSGVEIILLPGGQFTMGTNKGNPDEAPAHPVTLTAFAIDKFEVTGEMFAKAQLPNPSRWS